MYISLSPNILGVYQLYELVDHVELKDNIVCVGFDYKDGVKYDCFLMQYENSHKAVCVKCK